MSSSTLSLSGGSLGANANCIIAFTVQGTIAGPTSNAITVTSSSSSVTSAPASLCVFPCCTGFEIQYFAFFFLFSFLIASNPVVSMSYDLATIELNSLAVLTVLVSVPSGSPCSLFTVSFNFPLVATGTGALLITSSSSTCVGTLSSSGSLASLVGGQVAAGATCTYSFQARGVLVGTTQTSTIAVSSANAATVSSSAVSLIVTPILPKVISLNPTSGSTVGGSQVIITGTDFTGAIQVTFGATIAAPFIVDSATQITAYTPPGAVGTAAVVVTMSFGVSNSNVLFTYIAPPQVVLLNPTAGTSIGGTTVVITGTGFTGATTVTFDGTAATMFIVNSATQITAISPSKSAGAAAVVVSTNYGSSNSDVLFNFFDPAITSVTPNSGPTMGGTLVLIRGIYLNGVNNVLFGSAGAAINVVVAVDGLSITCESPPGSEGLIVQINVASNKRRFVQFDAEAELQTVQLLHSDAAEVGKAVHAFSNLHAARDSSFTYSDMNGYE